MPGQFRIALAAGDGIGPEIMDATLDLFSAAGVTEARRVRAGRDGPRASSPAATRRGMTDEAIATVEDCGVLFKGPMETPKGGGGKSINVTARKIWNAFANLRALPALPGVETVYSRPGIPVDFYDRARELEDTYGGVEHRLTQRRDPVQAADLGPGVRSRCAASRSRPRGSWGSRRCTAATRPTS